MLESQLGIYQEGVPVMALLRVHSVLTLQLGPTLTFFWAGRHGPLNENKVMGFHGVFMDKTWSHDLGFYWSHSEAQKGTEDKGQIKALVGGLPVTEGKGSTEGHRGKGKGSTSNGLRFGFES